MYSPEEHTYPSIMDSVIFFQGTKCQLTQKQKQMKSVWLPQMITLWTPQK